MLSHWNLWAEAQNKSRVVRNGASCAVFFFFYLCVSRYLWRLLVMNRLDHLCVYEGKSRSARPCIKLMFLPLKCVHFEGSASAHSWALVGLPLLQSLEHFDRLTYYVKRVPHLCSSFFVSSQVCKQSQVTVIWPKKHLFYWWLDD